MPNRQPFKSEEPYLAVCMGGQVGWWELVDGPPAVMTEMVFTVRAAQTTGGRREISLCMNLEGLRELAAKAQEALELAEAAAADPPPGDVEKPVTRT